MYISSHKGNQTAVFSIFLICSDMFDFLYELCKVGSAWTKHQHVSSRLSMSSRNPIKNPDCPDTHSNRQIAPAPIRIPLLVNHSMSRWKQIL